MDNYSLTETEFNSIGRQAFIEWFNTIQEHISPPYNKPAIDVECRCDETKFASIRFKTPNKTFTLLYKSIIIAGDKWSSWGVMYKNNFYKSPRSARLVVTSFNKFIEIEKTKLIAKPYGEDIVKEVEELFY